MKILGTIGERVLGDCYTHRVVIKAIREKENTRFATFASDSTKESTIIIITHRFHLN